LSTLNRAFDDVRMPPRKRQSGLMFQGSVQESVDINPQEEAGPVAGEKSAPGRRNRARDVVDAGKDYVARGVQKLVQSKKDFCAACKRIPFDECLPDSSKGNNESKQDAFVIYLNLETILDNSGICRLCSLLEKSICQEDHDLLKAEHIRKHLPETFDEHTSMSEWIPKYKDDDSWPFGFTSDRSGASDHAVDEAKRLFSEAEDRDTKMNNVSDMYQSITEDAALAVEAAQLALDMVPLSRIEDKDAREVFTALRFITRQVANIQNMTRARLPCIFMLRMYRSNEKKAGALSVRVYAHGGAALAPLQEITHFSLRFENTEEPRQFEKQLWYGNRLEKRIDIPFFKHCIEECRQEHSGKDGCASPLSSAVKPDDKTIFRLINVNTMSVKKLMYLEVMKGSKYPYAALSYLWGKPLSLEGWTLVSDRESVGKKKWKRRKQDGSWAFRDECLDRTKLRRGHESNILYRDGGLKDMMSSIPKTIRDAIDVTKNVGLDYIWVDQLCIIQDEGDPDKKLNIERMDTIYSHAQFTIVAADGKNADSGLRGVGCDRGELEQISEEIVPGANMSLPVNIKWDIRLWESRAWTFQEKVLSKRLLVFTGGCAIWYCRGGIWREDVNALDGDISAVRFPWPRMAASTPSKDKLEGAGLSSRADGGICMHRRSVMYDYVAAVEDLSSRDITNAGDILGAFRGVSKVLGTQEHLGRHFWQGLPVHFMDVALFWQTSRPAHRRDKADEDDRIPPSWSPFGWAADSDTVSSAPARTLIEYTKPYEVWSDGKGILLRRDPDGTDKETRKMTRCSGRVTAEERIRPIKHTLWKHNVNGTSLEPVGLFGRKEFMDGFDPPDWESSNSKTEQPRPLPAQIFGDRTLVIFAQTAMLILHQQTWRTIRTSYVKSHDVSRVTFENTDIKSDTLGETITTRQEYWLRAQKSEGGGNSEKGLANVEGGIEDVKIGVGRIDEADFGAINTSVKAVVLSEAQYLGNEDVPDVLGYPLYTVMLVRQSEKHARVYERVGLGHVHKSKWKKLSPRKETVCLI